MKMRLILFATFLVIASVARVSAQSGDGRRGRVRKPVNDGEDIQLICRGGPGLRVYQQVVRPLLFNPYVVFVIDFSHGTSPPDAFGPNLLPGQCSLAVLPLQGSDPAEIQLIPESVPLPWEDLDVRLAGYSYRLTKLQEHLKDPKIYLSFTVEDSGQGFFIAYHSKYFEPPAVKLVPRAKGSASADADTPPRSICDLAREARARNSPAASGLEAQCRAVGGTSAPPIDVAQLDDLATKGEALANADPLALELLNREPDDPSRRGFNIGMAAAEGQTLPGPGKQRIRTALSAAEQMGFDVAVAFSLERNRNADLAAKGAAIAAADPTVAEARTAEADVFYWLGFDIATGIFGDPAQGAQGNTAVGPGSLKIRDSLSPAGQRGFDASVKLHLSRNYKP